MAHKKIILLVSFLVSLCGFAASKPTQPTPLPPAIKSVGLVRGVVYDGKKQPDHCMVAIEATRDVYFKLAHNEQILRGGLLKTGVNLVDFNVPGLFEKQEIYRYILTIKEGAHTSSRPIIIESTVSSDQKPEKTSISFSSTQSRVSMFVANHLVASQEKKHQMKLTTQTAGEPRALDYGQYNPVNGRYQSLDRAGFSPLLLVGLAYKQIKKARDREQAKVEIKTHRSIHFDYLKESPGAKKERFQVSIKITAAGIH